MAPPRDTTTLQAKAGGTAPQAASPRASVTFYHREGTTALELAPRMGVVVGRGEPANVAIPDATLSRMHARLCWDGQVMQVTDLQSTNGTFVRGERIEEAVVAPGEALRLGQVSAVMHVLPVGDDPRRTAPLGFESAHELLAAEVRRARFFGRSAALCMVRLTDEATGLSLVELCERLRGALRAVDHLGLYSSDTALVLQPELDAAGAVRAAEGLAKELGRGAVFGVASFPETAPSHEALLGAAREACLGASAAKPVVVAEAARGPKAGKSEGVVCSDAQMLELRAMLRRVAARPFPVLVLGETGVGKEVWVRELHAQSGRSGPFVAVNCATLPRDLTESILFGHERGAFTGASTRATGLFEEANGGTLFLDEVGELPPSAQAALLRVLQERRIRRVGSAREVEVDVRVVAATHRDLDALSSEGLFRSDLLFRLNTVVLEVPPLRERKGEIAAMARSFLQQSVQAWGGAAHDFSAEALACLEHYPWPGNVRQLRNVVERAVALCDQAWISPLDLPPQLRRAGTTATGGAEADEGPVSGVQPGPGPSQGSLREQLREFEQRLLASALEEAAGSVSDAAKALGLPVRTLRFKLQSLGVSRRPPERAC